MHDGLELRPATLDDAPAVAALLHRCFCTFRDFAPSGWEPPTAAWQSADFDRRLRGIAVRTRVAVTLGDGDGDGDGGGGGGRDDGHGEVVAICGWMPARADAPPREPVPPPDHPAEEADPDPREPIPGLAHLWLLFVAPERWGTGLASDLLAWGQASMIDATYDAARLWTPAGQARARAFYERRRWRLTGREQFNEELGLQLLEYRVELR